MRHLLVLFALLLSPSLAAEPVAVPPALESWRAWALDGEEFRNCNMIAGKPGASGEDFICAWPGELQLWAGADGGQFAMSWQVQAESWVPLPGDRENWPQDVRVNGQNMPVLEHDDLPQLQLKPGNYAISGRISWVHRPQSLAVPDAIGRVRLQVDGQTIAPVQHSDGELVLGRGASEAPEADALDLRVYRRLQDDGPMTLETVIQITAAGQAREELIGPVLPPGFVPTALEVDSGWPARIEADGRLRIQVQPDIAEIRIHARALKPLLSTMLGKAAHPWPAQEIWSYASAPEQRVSSASGPPQVDPVQAQVPDDWRDLPAFAVAAGVPLNLEIRSRGLGANDSNRLQLQREAWLDFTGEGWTLRDGINGSMRQGWRLDAQPPYRLEDARDLNEDQALLVTQGDHATGVEWRTPTVNLSAGLRVQPASYALPVSGWRQTFDAVNTTLHLPSGYRLIAAMGADQDSGSWVSRWTLLDIFLVAIVGLLAWRTLGPVGAALALGYLLIDYHETGAPLYSLAIVLALGLLLSALPQGRVQRFGVWLRRVGLLLLVLLAVPFAAAQLRLALYPQLEGNIVQSELAGLPKVLLESPAPAQGMTERSDMAAPPPPLEAAAPAADAVAVLPEDNGNAKTLDRIEVTGSRIRISALMDRYSQTTIVQAGRGLPGWRGGQSYSLSWGGPVTANQSVRLLISPPWLTRLLRVLAIAALTWLLLRLSGARRPRVSIPAKPAMASWLLLLSLFAAGHPTVAQAQALPGIDLLQELRNRLTRAPDCAPDCAVIADAHIDARGEQLRVTLDIHAEAPSAVPVPTDAKSLMLDNLEVDGATVSGLVRHDGDLDLSLPHGVHRVQLAYRISGDRVALAFPMTPRAIEFSGDGWQASGITDARLLTETLSLNRLRNQGSGHSSSGPAQEFPTYVRVERTITLGLDWAAHTIVRRVAPKVGGFSVKLPVIAGEKVVTPGLLIRQGELEIPMPDGADSSAWDATLDKSDALSLRAPDMADHAEIWRVRVSPLWRAQFAGVPESVPQQDDVDNDWHEFVFHPLPGETLRIAVTRPEPASGSTQAIESVQLRNAVGQRASEYTLGLRLRASQGGERVLGLPEAAELLSVSRNNESMNLRLDHGKLSLPVQPGFNVYEVRFRDGDSVGLRNRTPIVNLGLPAANIDLGLDLPDNRWVLLTQGPQSGPAVLYWGELLVLLLVAYGLSNLGWTPLTFRDWLLLGIGFSTFSWIALAVVVAWLFALAWRERHGSNLAGKFRFDALQLALVAMSLAALVSLITAIPYGLLGRPDMHIVNPLGDDGALRWFADQSRDALPQAGAISVPMWLYRTAMLAWALWLANAVLGWSRWGLRAWIAGGYWRRLRQPKSPEQPSPDATPAGAESAPET